MRVFADELDRQRFEALQPLVEHVLLQLEVRDAVAQHAAHLRPRVEDRHGVAALRQLLRDGQPGRPGADDRDAAPGRPHGRLRATSRSRQASATNASSRPIATGFAFLPTTQCALAEALLRAEAPAHLRHRARLVEDVRGADDVALLELPERAAECRCQPDRRPGTARPGTGCSAPPPPSPSPGSAAGTPRSSSASGRSGPACRSSAAGSAAAPCGRPPAARCDSAMSSHPCVDCRQILRASVPNREQSDRYVESLPIAPTSSSKAHPSQRSLQFRPPVDADQTSRDPIAAFADLRAACIRESTR